MANNRMWLVHPSGTRVLLAKYYPSTNWWAFDGLERRLDEAFCKPERDFSMWGDTSWQLEYEIPEGGELKVAPNIENYRPPGTTENL